MTPVPATHQTVRAQSGRLLRCTPKAAEPYQSPIPENASEIATKNVTLTDSANPTRCTPVRRQQKRRSNVAITPLRKEVDVATPRRSTALSLSSLAQPLLNTGPSEDFDLCGLPKAVKDTFIEKRNIKQLYDWQKECLSDHRIQRGSNCIVSLPTGAGKTLIAEVLMIREAIVNKRSSILVLPYVAIVQEKITSLSVFEETFGIRIEEYAANKGRIPPIKRRKEVSIYVATIEKANTLINSLIETGELDRIGLVVVDELHMIGDGSRGTIIEQLLCKYLTKGFGQIIGMSATLSNINELAGFLRAYVYSTTFRPVELHEYVRIEQNMWKINSDGELEHNAVLPANRLSKADPDGLCQLLIGVIPRRSVLIFCPTKKSCESVALMVARCVPEDVRKRRIDDRKKVLESMKEDCEGLISSALENTILAGVAYHHSGLTHEERKHIEAAYSDGVICVVCATSTLAAGVNMPARRVIIKAPLVGCAPLGKAQYMQMVGRAGRAGFDQKGDSITIVRPGLEERQFRSMIASPMISCSSGLARLEYLTAFIVDLVTLKVVNSLDSLCEALTHTLLHAQIGYAAVRNVATEAIAKLKEDGLLVEDDEGVLSSSQLGTATFAANLSPLEAQRLSVDLTSSLNNGLVFSSHFHLLFTIAPYDAACPVDWNLFHDLYTALSESEKKLLSSYGIPECVILQHIVKRKQLEAGEPAMRLYIGLLLQEIWKQQPHAVVADKFGVDRGWLQSTLQNAIAQAAAVAKFSEKIPSLWPLRLLLPELVQRLSDCVVVELIPLMAIDCVKRGRARQLYAAGYKNVAKVAKASYKDLLRDIPNLSRFNAIRMVNSAKAILRDQVDEKMEELDAMGVEFSEIEQRVKGTS
uniref:Helicase POLQ-like n=1 Tax=Haemonchus contortus TaxID=6289 RepID=A0A6F7PH32_HAECO